MTVAAIMGEFVLRANHGGTGQLPGEKPGSDARGVLPSDPSAPQYYETDRCPDDRRHGQLNHPHAAGDSRVLYPLGGRSVSGGNPSLLTGTDRSPQELEGISVSKRQSI